MSKVTRTDLDSSNEIEDDGDTMVPYGDTYVRLS
jgi:hypothetical protein